MLMYETEEEQIEALKKWWQANGRAVIVGIILGGGGVLAWHLWQQHKTEVAVEASIKYQAMIATMEADNTDANRTIQQGEKLLASATNTPYMESTNLILAKLKLQQEDINGAKAHLQWILDHSKTPEMLHIARLRLAKILFQEDELDKAFVLLSVEDQGAFMASYEELLGDLYVAKQEFSKARSAYQKAQLANLQGSEFIQMKLDDLAEVTVNN